MRNKGNRIWSRTAMGRLASRLRRDSSTGPIPPAALARLRGWEVTAVLDGSSNPVAVIDVTGTVVFLNSSAERLFGYGPGQAVGRTLDVLLPQAARAVHALRQRRALDDRRPGPVGDGTAVTGVRREGTEFQASVWLTPAHTRRGLLIVATVTDLTEHRALQSRLRVTRADLQDARDALAAVLDALSERVIVLTDAEGRITAFNRAAERLLGYRADEVIGRSTVILSDPIDLAAASAELGIDPALDPLLEVARSGLPNSQEWTYIAKGGERRPVTLKVNSIGDRSSPSGFACLAKDLSLSWQPIAAQPGADRLLLELDDAPTRAMRWQVGGGSGLARRR